jgi:hypothetical protein
MKIVLFIFLAFSGMVLGGTYGIIHDEVTYTISPEFYTKVRFENMNIQTSAPRLGVAVVGWKNTWPYGLIIGLLLTTAGFIHPGNRKKIIYTFQTYFLSMAMSLGFGLLAYFVSTYLPEPGMNSIQNTIVYSEDFKLVQRIHNFSYMGGIAGMLLGLLWQFYKRKKDNVYFSRETDEV